MSVLIKGMELPKDCLYCKMAYYNASDEFTGCTAVPDKRYAMHNDAVYAKSTQRPDWCPLVEIPAHGRLIDADALLSEIKKDTEKAIEQDDRAGSFWLGYIAGLVIKQPTIQPEPSIPLSWIEEQIEWCKGLDNAFSTLTATQISAMVKKWRNEQDETD